MSFIINGIMLQGTSSHVGKSLLCTALCRIFSQDGYLIAPFKAQNMTLNSALTLDGGEIGGAQGVQAEAAGIPASVFMNPILLKPKEDMQSQVVVLGKPLSDMSAREYRENYLPTASRIVRDAILELQKKYQLLVIEGAGSPVELNLKEGDIVNMRTALWAKTPVILVADIDRGGVFASLLGTLELLEPWEKELVCGFIINKFRGDLKILESCLRILEKKSGLPSLGVVPYLHDHGIEEEDSLSLSEKSYWGPEDAAVQIAVIQMPRISNFTDIDPFFSLPNVRIRMVPKGERIGDVDAVIIPGTENTSSDLLYLKEKGYDKEILALAEKGSYILGICEGYHILGQKIFDFKSNNSEMICYEGLGLLNTEIYSSPEKPVNRVKAKIVGSKGWIASLQGKYIRGYEVEIGQESVSYSKDSILEIVDRSGRNVSILDGSCNSKGNVFGVNFHRFFDNREVLLTFYNALCEKKGLLPLSENDLLFISREKKYDNLAKIVRESLDMEKIYRIMESGT